MYLEESLFITNNDKVKAFTGLPSYTQLSASFTIIAPYIMKKFEIACVSAVHANINQNETRYYICFPLLHCFLSVHLLYQEFFTNILDVMFTCFSFVTFFSISSSAI